MDLDRGGASQRVCPRCRYQGLDAAGLFWLGRPRIVLRIIQGIYFENSLSGGWGARGCVRDERGCGAMRPLTPHLQCVDWHLVRSGACRASSRQRCHQGQVSSCHPSNHVLTHPAALHPTYPTHTPGAVAAVLFSVWQGIQFDWLSFGGWPVLASLIAVQLLLLAFMSLAVLPVYALTTAAGSHSAASGARPTYPGLPDRLCAAAPWGGSLLCCAPRIAGRLRLACLGRCPVGRKVLPVRCRPLLPWLQSLSAP